MTANADDTAALAADRATRDAHAAELAAIEQAVTEALATIDQAQAQALADATDATGKRDAAITFRDGETARAAAVSATTPALTVAYLTLVRDELALLHTRQATIAGSVVEVYQWRSSLDRGLALAYRMIAGLGRLAVTTLRRL